MIIGFTGTRHGMSEEQKAHFRFFLQNLFAKDRREEEHPATFFLRERVGVELHHGDCIGADADAHKIARDLFLSIVIHPPVDEQHRAFCHEIGDATTRVLGPRTHLARNRDIVDACDVLIACPFEMEHQSRGGTWYTHDYAIKKGKRVVLILRDGTVTEVKK